MNGSTIGIRTSFNSRTPAQPNACVSPLIETQLGRYQSPPLEFQAARDLLDRFATFFEQDPRSDIWIHAKAPEATLVLEEHNLVYGYGDLSCYRDELIRAGLRTGTVAMPSPHAHSYHADHDKSESELLAALSWSATSLRAEDR
jgi:hypothetical protein